MEFNLEFYEPTIKFNSGVQRSLSSSIRVKIVCFGVIPAIKGDTVKIDIDLSGRYGERKSEAEARPLPSPALIKVCIEFVLLYVAKEAAPVKAGCDRGSKLPWVPSVGSPCGKGFPFRADP